MTNKRRDQGKDAIDMLRLSPVRDLVDGQCHAILFGPSFNRNGSGSAIRLRQVGGANGTQHFPKDVIERWQMVHLVRETGGPEPP
jgi:hypothetical protein